MKSTTLEELEWRGLLYDVTDREKLLALDDSHSFYVGYDPTAPSLQLGNLLPMIVSIHLARAGLKPIQLFGGATGAIGDPSGRSAERSLLDRPTIDKHIQNHQRITKGIFERAGQSVQFVNNFDWTKDLTVLDFLRDIGKHFTVNYMIAKEVVKTRLEAEGISFTEFSYMLLQAYDYFYLHQNHKCRLQIGGSDQWGNITAGLELIRRKVSGEAYALSFPLLLDSQGRKFGKTADGAIWLDSSATSPYKFHQYWLNIDDRDVIRYLKVFTFLTCEEISALEAEATAKPEARMAQRRLADEMCDLVHGRESTQLAKRSAEVLFGGSLEGIAPEQLLDIFADVPSSELARSELCSLTSSDLFVKTALAKSKGEARRLMENGGAYINNNRISDPAKSCEEYGKDSSVLILRSGKKQYHLLKLL